MQIGFIVMASKFQSSILWIVTLVIGVVTICLSVASLVSVQQSSSSNYKQASLRDGRIHYNDFILPDYIKEEIWAHQENVNMIAEYILSGAGKHQAFDKLAILTDTYGHRMSGSEVLEEAIDFVMEKFKEEGFENVHGEDLEVPKWERGEVEVTMTSPRLHHMTALPLGASVGTNGSTISSEVVVVTSFEELENRSAEVPGKIVVYNQPWIDYGQSVEYRGEGASRASRHGAIAALIRSVTDKSIYSAHTGHQTYAEDVVPIPAICITVEDAESMYRITQRGEPVTVEITSTTANYDPVISRNLVGEIIGTEKPNETVIIGGHIDSWYVGTGAMDDAGGVVISWQAGSILKALGLETKRTVRIVGWTAEEFGLIGGEAYYQEHRDEANDTSLMLESDSGLWEPMGLGITGTDYTLAIIEEILQLVAHVTNGTQVRPGGSGPDVGFWAADDVPVGGLENYNADYFHYHHSSGDTPSMMNPDTMDLCTIVWTVVTYIVADLQDKLPRSDATPPPASGADTPGPQIGVLVVPLLVWCVQDWFNFKLD